MSHSWQYITMISHKSWRTDMDHGLVLLCSNFLLLQWSLWSQVHIAFWIWMLISCREDFVYFAEICFKSFGHKIKYWTTLNEPNLFADMAYIRGRYPPGHCSAPFGNCSSGNSDVEPLVAMHNMILAHAKAVKLYRQNFQVTWMSYVCMYACMYWQ